MVLLPVGCHLDALQLKPSDLGTAVPWGNSVCAEAFGVNGLAATSDHPVKRSVPAVAVEKLVLEVGTEHSFQSLMVAVDAVTECMLVDLTVVQTHQEATVTVGAVAGQNPVSWAAVH